MADLVLGPLLRYVGETEATVWVETSAPCEVSVLGCTVDTFCVRGHHYGLVHVTGLEPGVAREYEVALDGEEVWPLPGSEHPPSRIHPIEPGRAMKIVFGSCRVSAPHEPPYSLKKDEDERGREVDALRALALRMSSREPERWPRLLVLLGDQVYADEVSPETRDFIRSRRDTSDPPGEEIADFEEYTRLYREAWSDPPIRWLLSTVSSAMVFDDHDVHDDWNTSETWLAEMRAKPWWEERIAGALMSYWIYQHVGNLAPSELQEDDLFTKVCDARDAGDMLHEFALEADRTTDGSRWSYCRDVGTTRLVMIDSRAGRVLEDGCRRMVDPEEWSWIEEHAVGGVDHLLIGSSLPLLLAPGMHDLEAWNEAVCAGAWGGAAAKLGERLRQGLDLEHWAAFDDSFDLLTGLLQAVGAGERGEAPATIVTLSGDVHHAYLAEVAFRRGSGVKSAVYQAVCSPFRNPLDVRERRVVSFGASRAAALLGRLLTRAAGVAPPSIRWRLADDPVFDNQVATLAVDGRKASLQIEKATAGEDGERGLETTFERRLA